MIGLDLVFGKYKFIADLLLYFLIFSAIARAAFSRSFPGREGRVLAVAVGLVLGTGLYLAQKRLGFSLSDLGPFAVFLLCLVTFASAYKLLHHAGIPLPITLLLSFLPALFLVYSTFPRWFPSLDDSLSAVSTTALILVVGLAAAGSDSCARKQYNRQPGPQLNLYKATPAENDLSREIRIVKRKVRKSTRKNRRDESDIKKKTKQLLKNICYRQSLLAPSYISKIFFQYLIYSYR